MDMKLYGICFKMRKGPDLLSYIQSGENVPLNVMAQVLGKAGSLTQDELAFARLLDTDWKEAFGKRVSLYMGLGPDGGYDIKVNIPDPLLDTARLLTGKTNEELAGEYVTHYLKTVCGLKADIVSITGTPEEVLKEEEAEGFDLSDLGDEPEEEMEAFGAEEPVEEETPEAEIQEIPEEVPEPVEEEIQEEVQEPVEEEIPEEAQESIEEVPEEIQEPAEETPELTEEEEPDMAQKISDIYKDMVKGIRDKQLDTRLGLSINGQ